MSLRSGVAAFAHAIIALSVATLSCAQRPPLGAGDAQHEAGLLQSGQVTLTVPLPPTVPISSVSLGANSTLLIGSNVKVSEEGSSTGRSTIVNAGPGTMSTTQTGVSLGSDLWSVGSVFLASGTAVSGGVTTAGSVTQQTGVTVGGTILQHQALASVPTSWTVTYPASSTNVQLQPGQSQTLAPGGYATVSVAANATLTLQTGTYYFDQLSNEPSGKIAFTGPGPFVLYVRTSFMAKGPVSLPAVSPAPSLLIGVSGTNDVYLQTEVDGTVVAPNANLTLAAIGTAAYHGSFFGKTVTVQAGVSIQHRNSATGTVAPIAECVISQPDGTYKAVFGYLSSSTVGNVSIPVGSANQFSPGAANRGQPALFLSGRQRAQFAVPFDGSALKWTIGGLSTIASVGLPECTSSCVQHLVDPTKPRLTQPLSTGAPPLSEDESRVLRDTFRWKDTLPVPETFSDGTPRLYYGVVFVNNSAETLQTLDLLRIHYSNTPLFEAELSSYEQQGIQNKFSYPYDGRGQFVYTLMPGAIYNVIRQAALDPNQPVEIFRASPFRPIPASDLGFAPRASCGLQPTTQCVAQATDGSLRGVFSYTNPAGNPVTIPVGPDNNITGGPSGALPPEAFAAGTHTAVFAVPIPSGATVRWTLNGYTVSASTATVRCSASVVAQIGVDTFNPFPAPSTPSCRYAAPAEVQFPSSRLPLAARANTCVSMSYSYLGTLGFKWRGVDNDADDLAGQAADAAFAVGATGTMSATSSISSGDTQVVRSALFGKLFRKALQTAGGIVGGVIDAGRRGLRAVAGLFLGSTNVDITVDPQYADAAFVPGTMTQAWGAQFGRPISLQGLEIRANRSVFLSVANLDANNHAQVKVLNHLSGARLCFKMTNGAAFIADMLMPNEICAGSVGLAPITPPPAERVPVVVNTPSG